MAKSSWLTVFPMSGSGSATLTNTGTNHTGRNTRSTTVTATIKGLSVSRSYTVVQKALEEFVSITGDASVSVDREGQTLTLSGLSNSSKLTFTSNSTNVTVSSVYTANGATVSNGAFIAGDPGASAQYAFSILVTIPENTTPSSRSFTITVTTASGVKATWTLNQAASDITYTLMLSPSVSTIAAKGGSSTISGTLRTYRNGSLISTDSVTPICTVSGVVFSVSSENVVSVGTRGTIVGGTRSTIVTGSYRGSSMDSAVTATVTVYQEANARLSLKLHSSPVSYTDIGADGSAAIPTIISYPCFWEYTSGSSLDVAKSSLSISFSKNWGGGSSYNNATINVSNGYVTADSLGTTVKSRENLLDSRVTFMIDGQSVEEVVYVYQEANARTSIEYGTPFVSLTVVDIPASGGAISSGTVTYSQSQRQYYTSGGYENLSDITSGGIITYGSVVTASSLGTTIKLRSKVGTLTATVTLNGKSGSDTADVYQEANEAIYGGVSVAATTPVSIPASGGSSTILPNASQTVSYTSGSTRAGSVSFAYEIKTSKTGFSLSGATVTVTQNTSTSPRNGFVVMVTATGEGSKLATTDVTFNQAGAMLPSWNAQDNYNFDADLQDSVQISISDPNNRGWEIRGNGNEFIVVDQTSYRLDTPYSGTGSISFEFFVDPNIDTSSITNTVYLYSGLTLCGSFNYTQDGVVESLEVSPTELSFVANGEDKTITITSNGDWTIS